MLEGDRFAAAFFMNFLDGHIKQAPTRGRNALFYRCVRGPAWGENDFVDNGDGTAPAPSAATPSAEA